MRIEMCGPPTAGKSRLVKELRKTGIKRGPEGSLTKIPSAWRDFSTWVATTYSETSLKSLPDKTQRSLAAAWRGSKSKETMVFDELTILCGFSMAIRLPKEKTVYYFNNVPLPEVLIYLTAPPEVLHDRNIKRGAGNRWEKTKRCIAAHEKYIPLLKKRGCNIWTFDSSKASTVKIANRIFIRLTEMKEKALNAKHKRKS